MSDEDNPNPESPSPESEPTPEPVEPAETSPFEDPEMEQFQGNDPRGGEGFIIRGEDNS